MSLVMEEQSQPVFRDFLGSGQGPNPEPKQPEMSATDSVRISQNSGFMEQEDGEASVRGGSTFSAPGPSAPGPSFPTSSDPGTEMWRHSKSGGHFSHVSKGPCMNDDIGRKRDEPGNRASFRDNLHEPIEGSRPMKVSRFKQRENDALPNTGELCLSMQPPRTSQAGNLWQQTSVFKTDLSSGSSRRVESSRPVVVNAGVPLPARSGQIGSAAGMFSRNSAGQAMQPPPADEGSRTGLQGGIAALINNSASKLPSGRPGGEASVLERSATLERSKIPHQSSGSDSLLPSHKASTSSTRQLTIFYGGQAHVFDDVTPDKANEIMQLAGSNGRSWSTTYAHRSSRSEGSLVDLERRREKSGHGSPTLGISSDVQNMLHGLNHQTGGQPPRKHRFPPDQIPKHPGDVQVPPGVAAGSASRFGVANGRAAGIHGSFYNMKEAGSNGPHWL